MGHSERSRSPNSVPPTGSTPSNAMVPINSLDFPSPNSASVPHSTVPGVHTPKVARGGPGGQGVQGIQSGMASPIVPTTEEMVAKVVQENINKLSHELFQSIQANVSTLVTTVQSQSSAAINNRLDNVESRLDNVQTQIGSVATSVDSLAAQFAAFKADFTNGRLGPSDSPGVNEDPQTTTFPTGFNRSIDPTLVLVNTMGKVQVARSVLHDALVPLLSEAGIASTNILLSGDSLDNTFELKFLGNQVVAKQNCSHFLSSLSLGRGKYKKQSVANQAGEQIQFFCQPDKSPCQVRKEVLAKKLQAYLRTLVPSTVEVWVRKATGTILIDKRPLVSVRVQNEESAILHGWSDAKLALHKLDKAGISAHFATLVSEGSYS